MVRYGEQIKSFHLKGKDLEALEEILKTGILLNVKKKRVDKMNRLDKSVNHENRTLILKVFFIPHVRI